MTLCPHSGREFPEHEKRYCRNPAVVGAHAAIVSLSQCSSCELRDATTAQVKAVSKICQHRGEIQHQEPCSCGGAVTIPIYACGLHKRCFASETERSKVEDKDVKRAVRACDRCNDFVSLDAL